MELTRSKERAEVGLTIHKCRPRPEKFRQKRPYPLVAGAFLFLYIRTYSALNTVYRGLLTQVSQPLITYKSSTCARSECLQIRRHS